MGEGLNLETLQASMRREELSFWDRLSILQVSSIRYRLVLRAVGAGF
jgi:hypothetical protein